MFFRLDKKDDAECSVPHFAGVMGHRINSLVSRMKRDGVLEQFGRPAQRLVNGGYFAVTEQGEGRFGVELTGKGQIWLARKYPAGFDLEAA